MAAQLKFTFIIVLPFEMHKTNTFKEQFSQGSVLIAEAVTNFNPVKPFHVYNTAYSKYTVYSKVKAASLINCHALAQAKVL